MQQRGMINLGDNQILDATYLSTGCIYTFSQLLKSTTLKMCLCLQPRSCSFKPHESRLLTFSQEP